MSKKQYCSWVLLLVLSFLTFSCKDDKDEPIVPQDVAKNIVGKWLLASSGAENWVSYEFTESSRINVKLTKAGYYHNGDGWYSIDESKAAVSGSYTTERSETFYLDWIVEKVEPFQIDFKLYDNNTYLGVSSIYRVLSSENVEVDGISIPDYRGICGSSNVSNFRTLDSNIASVDEATGEITGVSVGTTFITFSTSNGRAAIEVEVLAKAKTFAELVLGTWVYDAVSEKTWERYTFEENGFVSVQWTTNDGVYNLNESAQSTYKIDGETVSFSIKIAAGQMNMRLETESINDFNWTYKAFDGSHANGKYTVQKVLQSITMEPGGVVTPDYQSLTAGYEITGYSSHNTSIASVDANTGTITAVSKGRTYVDVQTAKGVGVIEVNNEGGAIPYEFQDCLGKAASAVKDMLGTPFYEDETTIIYKNLTNAIELVGASLDSFTGFVKGITITYNENVKVSDVTSILDATFIPFASQTTATFKAYMDTENRSDATIGVTWDIPQKTLTYVNLATDLFTDYSLLIGMTRSQVISKMGREPDTSNDQSQSFFFFDKKGIAIVSAYYTDFVNNYDNVRSVVTMFDDTLSSEKITSYLKKKYPYYPEYSTDDELVFIPDGHAMGIYYTPKDKMIMYISTSKSSKIMSRTSIASKLRCKAISIKR